MSVRDTTPDNLPDIRSPGNDAAEMEGLEIAANGGEEGRSAGDAM